MQIKEMIDSKDLSTLIIIHDFGSINYINRFSIFEIVIYKYDPNNEKKLKHKYIDMISNSGTNDVFKVIACHLELFRLGLYKNIKTIKFFSDGGPHEFRDSQIFTLFLWLLNNSEIKNIEYIFHLPYHGHNPADGGIGQIKNKIKIYNL